MVPVFKFIVLYIIPAFELIPIIVGILNYKFLTKALRVIFYLSIFSLLMDGLNAIMEIVYHQPSKPYVDALAILDFPIISAFYMLVLSKKWKGPIIIFGAVYYLLWIADYWFIEKNNPMNVYPLTLEYIFIMVYAIGYINQQTQRNIEEQWSANPVNWINSGYLILCAASIMLHVFYDLMLKKHVSITAFTILWEINDTASVIQLILFSIGLYKSRA